MTDREQTRRDEPSRYADPYTRNSWYEERLEQVERERDALLTELNAHVACVRELLDALEALETWEDDFGSKSITGAVWTARNKLRTRISR